MSGSLRLVVTDSGLGGLSVCAEIERNLRLSGAAGPARLVYVNSWPEESGGYNSMPTLSARALVFDRALATMDGLHPDRILIACNTLSILYPGTAHARRNATPVQGIVDVGIQLFADELAASPETSLVLLGTRTTIDSGVHRDGLIGLGIDSRRIAPIACHGMAGAIEANPRGAVAATLIEQYLSALSSLELPGTALLAGLACTHYGYVADAIAASLERHGGKAVRALDPNHAMARSIAPPPAAESAPDVGGDISVEVMSKVRLAEDTRRGIGALIESVSPATARALADYRYVPDLF